MLLNADDNFIKVVNARYVLYGLLAEPLDEECVMLSTVMVKGD